VIVVLVAEMQGDRMTTMSEAHNILARPFLKELWPKGYLDAIEEFLVPNSVRHVSHTGMRGGRNLEQEGILCTHR
jgi:hypothetical protein